MNLKLYHFKVALLFEVKTISTYNADKKLESLFFNVDINHTTHLIIRLKGETMDEYTYTIFQSLTDDKQSHISN